MDSKSLERESAALELLGGSFVKMPRSILMGVFHQQPHERAVNRVHLALFSHCNFIDGVAKGRRDVPLHRGECCFSYVDLASLTGVNPGTIRYLVGCLERKGLVEVSPMGQDRCFRVMGYDAFTAPGIPERPFDGKVSPECLARRMMEDESRIFGECKPRTDLLNYES